MVLVCYILTRLWLMKTHTHPYSCNTIILLETLYLSLSLLHRDGENDPSSPLPVTPPPDYTLTAIPPPVYQDALQDVIVSPATGNSHLNQSGVIPESDL